MNFIASMEDFFESFLNIFSSLPTRIDPGNIPTLLFRSLLIAFVFVALLILAYKVLNRLHIWKVAERWLPALFTSAWFFGFVVYDVGMCTEERISLLRNAPMAVIHAFEMFLIQSDVSAIHDGFHDNAFYMGLFSLAHFYAALVSLLFVIKLFGFQVTNGILRILTSFTAKLCSKRPVLYIFWGMNEPSYLLAKDILKRQKANGKGTNNFRIIIVRTNHDEAQSLSPNGLSRLFNFLSLGAGDFAHLEDLCSHPNVYTSSTYADISKTPSGEGSNLFRAMRLQSLARFIEGTSKEIHIFCFGADENENLLATSALKHSSVLASSKLKVTLYCHARRDSIKRVIEDTTLLQKNLEVRVVDSSHLAVEELRSKPEAQPVHFVDVKPDGKVCTPFNALVVGFGETGRDAVRFLYEFGAFVDATSSDTQILRSPFHCHIVDAQANLIKGKFIQGCPQCISSLTFHTMDYREQGFYDEVLAPTAKNLNYVLISVDDDEKNITLAVDILRYVRRHRNDLRNFCIYVRTYQQNRVDHIQAIADHYNQSYGLPDCIRIFGQPEEIYTYQMIVGDVIRRQGARFYCNYEGINAPTEEDALAEWEKRRNKKFSKDLEANKYVTAATLQAIRRMEGQDIANAFHRATKLHIARTMFGEEELQRIAKALHDEHLVRENHITYHDANGNDLPELTSHMGTLAQLEHLRWNAAHEMQGYVKGKEKDEEHLTHNCLTTWENLPNDEVRGYDFAVVDTTLRLYAEECNC